MKTLHKYLIRDIIFNLTKDAPKLQAVEKIFDLVEGLGCCGSLRSGMPAPIAVCEPNPLDQ
jgi:hypothetical protein